MAQSVKNLPAVQETLVRYPDGEDPLAEGMTTDLCILTWRIPRTEEPDGLQPRGLKGSDRTEVTDDPCTSQLQTRIMFAVCHTAKNLRKGGRTRI